MQEQSESIQTQEQKPPPAKTKKDLLRTILQFAIPKIIPYTAGALSALGLLSFWPRLSIEISEPTDPLNSFSITADITNIGFLVPLQDVWINIGLGQILSTQRSTNLLEFEKNNPPNPNIKWNYEKAGFGRAHWRTKKLKMDEKFSVRLEEGLTFDAPMKLGAADIAVVVHYKFWFLPFEFSRAQRFCTRARRDGKLDWVYMPEDQ